MIIELIDKAAIVAEIIKIYDRNRSNGYIDVCNEIDDILSFLDTLEVKEVDLEKEMDAYWDKYCNDEFGELVERSNESFDNIAKYFYELGLKAKKGE